MYEPPAPGVKRQGAGSAAFVAVQRATGRLTDQEGIDPVLGGREIRRLGVLDLLDPVTGAEDVRHRLGLEGGLATEEIRDCAARLAFRGGEGVGIEAGERADRQRPVVEEPCVLAHLLEHSDSRARRATLLGPPARAVIVTFG